MSSCWLIASAKRLFFLRRYERFVADSGKRYCECVDWNVPLWFPDYWNDGVQILEAGAQRDQVTIYNNATWWWVDRGIPSSFNLIELAGTTYFGWVDYSPHRGRNPLKKILDIICSIMSIVAFTNIITFYVSPSSYKLYSTLNILKVSPVSSLPDNFMSSEYHLSSRITNGDFWQLLPMCASFVLTYDRLLCVIGPSLTNGLQSIKHDDD